MMQASDIGETQPHATPGTDGSPLIEMDADLDKDGQFGRRTLRVYFEKVQVKESDGSIGFDCPIADIASARNDGVVGGGWLQIKTKEGRSVRVMAYSSSLARRFSEAARGIEQLAKGEPLSINLKQEVTRCPRCGKLLPEKDGICPACVKKWKTVMRIGEYMKPYRGRAIALAFLSLFGTALNLAPPYIQGTLVDKVLTRHEGFAQFGLLMLAWLAVLVLGNAVQIINGRNAAFLGSHIAADLRSALYQKIELLKLAYFDRKQVGSITSRVTNDTQNLDGFLVNGVPFLVTNLLMFSGVVFFIFYLNWKLAICILAPAPIVIFISATFRTRIRANWVRRQQRWAKLTGGLSEAVSGIKVMKAFAQEANENRKFAANNTGVRDASIITDRYWITAFGVMTFFVGAGMLMHWAVGGWMVYAGTLSLGNFWRIQQYLALVYGPMQWFAQVNNWFNQAMAGAERVFEVLDTEGENYGDATPIAPSGSASSPAPDPIRGEVVFDNVRFGYDKSNPVIKGISFKVQPGEMIGLVGRSGSGKSTTINLICRFYEPDSGTILIDGVDYRGAPLQSMRSQIGVVLQEPFLFNGTISDNIAYGKPDASFEEIMDAARAANAHGFILAKPDGYDFVVGERGGRLSGGERQRLSIARAILHNPRILILDEATSSVDVETEKQIQEAIGRLVKGRTTFAIAHRLSTLRNANRLIVMERGEIKEIGTHEELLAKDGIFAKLVKTQKETTAIVAVGA